MADGEWTHCLIILLTGKLVSSVQGNRTHPQRPQDMSQPSDYPHISSPPTHPPTMTFQNSSQITHTLPSYARFPEFFSGHPPSNSSTPTRPPKCILPYLLPVQPPQTGLYKHLPQPSPIILAAGQTAQNLLLVPDLTSGSWLLLLIFDAWSCPNPCFMCLMPQPGPGLINLTSMLYPTSLYYTTFTNKTPVFDPSLIFCLDFSLRVWQFITPWVRHKIRNTAGENHKFRKKNHASETYQQQDISKAS